MVQLSNLKPHFTNSDVKQGDVITFKNSGEILEVDFSKAHDGSDMKTVLQIGIELPNGIHKTFIPNATSKKALLSAWTGNTDKWVGKKAEINFLKTMAFGNEMDVLILKPLEEETWKE